MTFPIIILDASCVITLVASGVFAELAESLEAQFAIAELVYSKALIYTLSGQQDQDGLPIKLPVDLRPYLEAGWLEVVDFSSEAEERAFVTYASQLDAAEAVTLAMAGERGWAAATDDRKAIRVAASLRGPLRVWTTPDLIRHWAEVRKVQQTALRGVLNRIQAGVRYHPRRGDALYSWWSERLEED